MKETFCTVFLAGTITTKSTQPFAGEFHGPGPPNPNQNDNGHEPASIADELKRESERLRQLADELKKREELQAETQANYPTFKRIVYDMLKEQFELDLLPIPEGKTLEEVAAEEGALPLEAFIGELEQMEERR